jgi:hypothetical protein
MDLSEDSTLSSIELVIIIINMKDVKNYNFIVTHCYATAGKHLLLLVHDNNKESIAITILVGTCY